MYSLNLQYMRTRKDTRTLKDSLYYLSCLYEFVLVHLTTTALSILWSNLVIQVFMRLSKVLGGDCIGKGSYKKVKIKIMRFNWCQEMKIDTNQGSWVSNCCLCYSFYRVATDLCFPAKLVFRILHNSGVCVCPAVNGLLVGQMVVDGFWWCTGLSRMCYKLDASSVYSFVDT